MLPVASLSCWRWELTAAALRFLGVLQQCGLGQIHHSRLLEGLTRHEQSCIPGVFQVQNCGMKYVHSYLRNVFLFATVPSLDNLFSLEYTK